MPEVLLHLKTLVKLIWNFSKWTKTGRLTNSRCNSSLVHYCTWLNLVNFPLDLTFYECQWSKFFWCWLTFWLWNWFYTESQTFRSVPSRVKSWFISLTCIQLMYSNDNTYLHNIVTCIMHLFESKTKYQQYITSFCVRIPKMVKYFPIWALWDLNYVSR